ncbi:nicotinate-nucleotide--dimethylbenzimidazole phosphoribosyltransferase [Bacterioplanoides sp.]|uniref:nicotinate-nucleotide--dimethylbenzimidazole phosphoribosyltransferase n=1 Tax=Bacterioplanoides sp. TaxID=2066072 RepID=UPI003B0070D8
MSTHHWWQQPAANIHDDIREQASLYQSQLTKPPGALGKLESLALELAAMQGRIHPEINHAHCIVFAADHGVTAQGVSAFPQAVTVEMLKNFVCGGAAISVLSNQNQFELSVVNCGTATYCGELEGVIHQSIAAGTADFSRDAAMTPQQAEQALQVGFDQLQRVQQAGCDLFFAGDMGIGNTSAASATAAVLMKCDVATLTGPGTGVYGKALDHKTEVLVNSVQRAQGNIQIPLDALIQLGGFEIGAIAGAYIRAAQLGIPVLVDGFITTSAALLAVHLNPSVRDWLLFSHGSAEPGHQQLLASLQATPLLDLSMRLGEGSGAAVALPLLRQALALHNQMATFAQAGVSESGLEEH